MPVRVLEHTWSTTFDGKPKLFFGFYSGYKYVLTVAGSAELVVKSLGSHEYVISLVLKKVAVTYVKVGVADASAIMDKFVKGKLLKVSSAPISSFSKVMLYDKLTLNTRVKVDDEGRMYWNGMFAGTWPFKLPKSKLLVVVPKAYYDGVNDVEELLTKNRAHGLVIIYTIRKASNEYEAVASAPTTAVASIRVGKAKYLVVNSAPFFAPYILRYDPTSGLLKSIVISEDAINVVGGSIPSYYYSLMLPTPMFNTLSPNAQVLLTPLGQYNLIKLVLEGND